MQPILRRGIRLLRAYMIGLGLFACLWLLFSVIHYYKLQHTDIDTYDYRHDSDFFLANDDGNDALLEALASDHPLLAVMRCDVTSPTPAHFLLIFFSPLLLVIGWFWNDLLFRSSG